jgi:Protein of unknown function (DUF2423)
MAKSIRSHSKKKFRSIKRATVGAVTFNKHLRQTSRRLKSIVNKNLSSTDALNQENGANAEAIVHSSLDDILGNIRPPKKLKKLRHTFNPTLRKQRIDVGLEDLTDDEMEVRMGLVDPEDMGVLPTEGNEDQEEEVDESEKVELAGVKMAAHRILPKRIPLHGEKEFAYDEIVAKQISEGPIGAYLTSATFTNPKRERSHRRSKVRRSGKGFNFSDSYSKR